jgi:glycerophosphoryl diester phosphodiesterase
VVEEKLKSARALSAEFSSEPVPTLDAVLALLAPANLARVYIELKDNGSSKERLLDSTLSLVRKFGMQQSVTLLSFDHEAMRRAKEIAPDIRTAATFPVAARALATARSILRQAESVAADEAALHFSLATRRTVAALHEGGLSVSAWTANNRVVMRRLITAGVDSIMTNFPDRLVSALDSQGLISSGAGGEV